MKIELKNIYEFQKMLLVNGFTKRGYGRAIGISESYAVQIANGKRNPSPSVAKRTSDLLQVDFDDIFFTTNACKSDQFQQVI